LWANFHGTYATESCPDPEDIGVDGGGHVGCGVCDCPVEQPVGGGGHREGLGSDLQGEDLTGDNPSARAPRT
jgi:hypothetical protein